MVSEPRFVITVRVIGSMLRDSPKLKVFMLSVSWSDETEVLVYRSFSDFKKFHKQLKTRFPHVNPRRRNDRTIPKFNGKARRTFQQKGSKRAVQRMKLLENYCEELLRCDQIVTQSSELTQFFVPRDHDLQADFTRNSIMVMFSDGSDGEGDRRSAGNISHPLVSQTYRCVAAYEAKDTKNQPFKVAVDQNLDVLIKDPAGWWLVENEEKRLAWFPAPYLELLEREEEEEDDDPGLQLGGSLYCALRSYKAKTGDEVSVPIGSVVEVLRKSDDGWWLIRFNGRGGYIPSMYLKPYLNPRAGLYSLHRKLHSSTLTLSAADPRTSPTPSGAEEAGQRLEHGPLSRAEPGVGGRLHKARSLDVLSESWTQAQAEQEASTSASYQRRVSQASTELSFSGFSSDSESSSIAAEDSRRRNVSESGGSSPVLGLPQRHDTKASTRSSGSAGSSGSETANAPRVPPRPNTQEILSRCTTMTRKAALATKTRVQNQNKAKAIRSR